MEKITPEHKAFLDIITADFPIVGDTLKQAIFYIEKSSEFTNPIIIVSEEPTSIGEIVIEKGEFGNSLTYYATYLDFLIEKKIFPVSDVDNFKEVFNTHKDHCCMLIMFQETMNFLYIPYP